MKFVGRPCPWFFEDYNLIYQAQDKSVGRLQRGLMGCFHEALDDLELAELHLLEQVPTSIHSFDL